MIFALEVPAFQPTWLKRNYTILITYSLDRVGRDGGNWSHQELQRWFSLGPRRWFQSISINFVVHPSRRRFPIWLNYSDGTSDRENFLQYLMIVARNYSQTCWVNTFLLHIWWFPPLCSSSVAFFSKIQAFCPRIHKWLQQWDFVKLTCVKLEDLTCSH